ncbi:hypothetical protein C9446_05520 [Providencia heimbachae]|uniref:hypothetical protein n=1 Tax=Providencia heimbachae TaxID=333962 RepID=UPI0010BEB0BC|nr:hypothetical protein [Providencia heimbachae]QCJ69368.1 hypothetical protein C9446_05520 [Providencia heimbachae]
MKRIFISIIIMLSISAPSLANTVKVFNGRGLIGVYGNYSASVTHNTSAPVGGSPETGYNPFSYVQLYNYYNGIINYCNSNGSLVSTIDGITGVPIANGEMIIVPEFTYVDRRTNSFGQLIDVITGHFNGWGSGTNEQLGIGSCIWSPNQSTPEAGMFHKATATGRLLIYGTGKQRSGTYYLQYDLGLSIQNPRGATKADVLVPKTEPINVIVSGLTCSLSTPTYINFGSHSANSAKNELLATITNNMNVTCGQNNDPASAIISISGNVKPQYYSGNNAEVNLLDSQNNPGAYVKIYVKKGSTKIPITLDQQSIDLSNISANQPSVSFTNDLIYELYSRGNNITGKVSGSAELSIIMR